MSLAELKEQIAELPREERFKLSAFLAELEETGEAEFRRQVDGRMTSMDRGEKVTAEEFEKRHEQRRQDGR